MSGIVADLPGLSWAQFFLLPAPSTLIITVNNRLARRIGMEYAHDLRNRDLVVAELPSIVPLTAWIRREFDRAGFESDTQDIQYALDPFATQLLWSEVIREQEDQVPLLDVGQAASAAIDADALMLEWDVQVNPSEATPEYDKFSSWRDLYTQKLHALQAIDGNRLFAYVIQRLYRQGIPGIEHVVFAGFTETAPRLHRLLSALEHHGIRLSKLSMQHAQAADPKLVQCQTPDLEWRQAAHWARSMLQAYPDRRFAIVAANLERVAPFARRVLHNTLEEPREPGQPAFSFNVAVGRPLSDWPVGRAMMAWLTLFCSMRSDGSCGVVEIGKALLAGHCKGHSTEMGLRGSLDARLRDKQLSMLSLDQWLSEIKGLEHLSSAWALSWEVWDGLPDLLTCDAWADVFRLTLSRLGFPGDVSQRSAEYQATEALSDLLERMIAVTPVLGAVSATTALHALSRLSRQTLFQPQRDPGSRLDVLGLLEAEGGSWDAVWVLGLTDEVLPAAPKPNPFLPVSALRRANAPRATPDREREWAHQLYAGLCQTAPQIWVSHPRMDGERELRPSSLIAGLSKEQAEKWVPTRIRHGNAQMESLDDQLGPPVTEREQIVGGVSLLETQSRNPLWAFFRHRLNVRGLRPHALLPPKTQRGVLIHGVFEQLWSDIHGSDDLKRALEDEGFDDRLADIARSIARQKMSEFPSAIRDMEVTRACHLVRQWLEIEAARTLFHVVGAEHELLFEHAPLALNMRLDRLDVLPDGRRVVIDYKTGSELPDVLKDWTHPRPVHVQLLAYAVQVSTQVGASGMGAMVLAHLHPSRLGAKGIYSGEDIGLPGLKSFDEAKWADADWDQAMNRLSESVYRLVDEFCAGHAQNVTWRNNDLAYCDILPILRCFDLVDEEASDD